MAREHAILSRLYRHNLWANERMLEACAELTDAQLGTEVAGTYGRVDHTLIHLARAQGGYVQTLTDWTGGPEDRLEYDAPFPGVNRIASHLRFTGERLLSVAERIAPDDVVEGRYDDEPFRLPAWVVLLQAAYHATEHRQQIATMLTHLGLEPPEPDLWHYWETVRAAPDAEDR